MQARPANNSSSPDRWGTAVGNLEDAKVTLATLAHAIEDAVYLDEDAFTQMQPVAQFQRTTQASNHPSSVCLPLNHRDVQGHILVTSASQNPAAPEGRLFQHV